MNNLVELAVQYFSYPTQHSSCCAVSTNVYGELKIINNVTLPV